MIRQFLTLSLIVLLLCACASENDNHASSGGLSGGGTGGQETDTTMQAKMGPIINATVHVHMANDPDSPPLCETTTRESTDLQIAGTFTIPNSCMNDDSVVYLITIIGGQDIDLFDDGIIDEVYTDRTENLHALFLTKYLSKEDMKINKVTNAAYQSAINLIKIKPQEEVRDYLDNFAKNTLARDLTGDGEINYYDVLVWDPALANLDMANLDINSSHDHYLNYFFEKRLNNAEVYNIDGKVLAQIDTAHSADDLVISGNTAIVESLGEVLFYELDSIQLPLQGLIPNSFSRVSLVDVKANMLYLAETTHKSALTFIDLMNDKASAFDLTLKQYDITDPGNPILVNSFTRVMEKGERIYALVPQDEIITAVLVDKNSVRLEQYNRFDFSVRDSFEYLSDHLPLNPPVNYLYRPENGKVILVAEREIEPIYIQLVGGNMAFNQTTEIYGMIILDIASPNTPLSFIDTAVARSAKLKSIGDLIVTYDEIGVYSDSPSASTYMAWDVTTLNPVEIQDDMVARYHLQNWVVDYGDNYVIDAEPRPLGTDPNDYSKILIRQRDTLEVLEEIPLIPYEVTDNYSKLHSFSPKAIATYGNRAFIAAGGTGVIVVEIPELE